MDVNTEYIGIPHYYATCNSCDWTYEDHRDRRKGQREIRKHVSNTGHTVELEKAVVVQYSPAMPPNNKTQADLAASKEAAAREYANLELSNRVYGNTQGGY